MITVILMMNVMIIKQRMNNKNNESTASVCGNKNNNKQIFHAFLFNIRSYSPEVINIILLRVNNYWYWTKKDMEYLFYYMAPAPNNISENKG